MLADTVFIVVNVNKWSNVLRRTLELDFPSYIRIYKCLSSVILTTLKMSKENDEYNLRGIPSTSGSSPSSWNCSDVNYLNENMQTQPEGYIPNLVLTHPIMSLHSVAAMQPFYNVNFYQNNYYYMGENFQQNLNRRYYQTDRREREIINLGQRNGSTSKKQSSCWLLLLTLYLLLNVSLSDAMGNSYEEKNIDQRLLSLRKWENVSSENQGTRPGFIFTVMCYNVLSQDLLVQHPHLYNRHASRSLQWSVRWNNLYNEITKFKPDVLCLQEVQESHISHFFSILETIGYSSVYKRRTGGRTDGCALYYKTDLMQLVEELSVEFFQPNISILNRDNVGLIAKFSPKLHPTREFVVATTHLLYNPRRQDVRLAQMQLLLTEIERMSYNKKQGNYLPVILTGDLNSTPNSAIYEFITEGKLKYEDLSPKSLTKGANSITGKLLVPSELRITDNCQHADLIEIRMKNQTSSRKMEFSVIEIFHSEKCCEKLSNKTEVDAGLFSTGTLSHNFGFKSVYNQRYPDIQEGTTFQEQWVTVDYIFYSTKNDINKEEKLKLLSRYRLPTKEELTGINIPNSVVGSDHLSLMAKFKLEY